MPDDFDKKLKAWKLSNLPIIPPEFQLKPIASNKKEIPATQEATQTKGCGMRN